MQNQEIFKLIVDANKNAYDNTLNAINDFQEKAEEAMKSAFDKSHLPQSAKDAALKTIDAYKIVVKQVLDSGRVGYENAVKNVTAGQEKAEQMTREYFEKSILPEETKKAFLAAMGLDKKDSTPAQKMVEKTQPKVEEIVEG